jgi:hypothetical protein
LMAQTRVTARHRACPGLAGTRYTWSEGGRMVSRPEIELWLPDYRDSELDLSIDEAVNVARECEELLRAGDRRSREEIVSAVLAQKVRCEGCDRLVPDDGSPAQDDEDGWLRMARLHAPRCPTVARQCPVLFRRWMS